MVIPVEALPEERGCSDIRANFMVAKEMLQKDIMEIIVGKIECSKILLPLAYSEYSYRDAILIAIRKTMKTRMKTLFPMWDATGYADVPNPYKGSGMCWNGFFKISRRLDEDGNYGFYVIFNVAKWDKLVKDCAQYFRDKALEQLRILEDIEK